VLLAELLLVALVAQESLMQFLEQRCFTVVVVAVGLTLTQPTPVL
jgi:hypothetical protein